MVTQQSTVVGVFDNRAQADKAVAELRRVGFRDDQIGITARNDETVSSSGTGSKWEEGAVAGAVAGAGVGGLVGLGILAGVIPVIGPIIAGGTLAVILANAAGGAAIAGIVGALVGMGIPEKDAQYYEGEFKSGRTLVTVKADGKYNEAWNILHGQGAYNKTTPRSTTQTAYGPKSCATSASEKSATMPTGAGQTMQLHEEKLRAHKQSAETGDVRIHKEVITEHKTLEVPVTREEVVIERHPVSGRQASRSDIGAGQEIRVPVREEHVRIEKENVVTEEVNVGKRQVQGTEKVSENVRKEQVKVDQQGQVKVRGNVSNTTNPPPSR